MLHRTYGLSHGNKAVDFFYIAQEKRRLAMSSVVKYLLRISRTHTDGMFVAYVE